MQKSYGLDVLIKVMGGAISAGTAGAIIAALGEAYIGIMELVFKGEMSIDDIGTKKGKGGNVDSVQGESERQGSKSALIFG